MVKAIEHWNHFTCLNFRWGTSDDVNRVKLQNGPMCGAQVGMVGGEQALFLGRGCGVVSDILTDSFSLTRDKPLFCSSRVLYIIIIGINNIIIDQIMILSHNKYFISEQKNRSELTAHIIFI